MKIETLNPHNLTFKDIDKQQHRVKVILLNSKGEVLLCKRNGVYNFIGGHIENGEGPLDCAQREVREETGITMRLGNFSAPFYKLESFEQNYYNLNKNYFTTIQFLEGKTDAPIDLSKRHLDERESKQVNTLEYVPYTDLRTALENNRDDARSENREFIIDEMLHVLDQYDEYIEQNRNSRGRDDD